MADNENKQLIESMRSSMESSYVAGREMGRLEAIGELISEAIVFIGDMPAKYDGIGSRDEASQMLRDFVARTKARIEARR